MAKIVIGFSKPHKWKPYSWLIMKLFDTNYSHVYIKFYSDSLERDLIYQASGTSLNFCGLNHFCKNNTIVSEFDVSISTENRKKMLQFAIDNEGKPYGVWNAVGLGIKHIARKLGFDIKNPFADGKKTEVCSELVAFVLQEHTELEISWDINEVTPKDIHDYLVKIQLS